MTAQNKTIILIIISVFIFLGLLAGYFLVKSTGKSLNEITLQDVKQFFPTSTSVLLETVPPPIGTGTIGEEEEEIETVTIPILRQISSTPTAGFTTFPNGTTDIIRYVEKATGHVYETKSDSLTTVKISNTTIPKIHEAFWVGENSIIFRFLNDDMKTIESFYGEIKQKTATSTGESMEGFFLQTGIKEMSILNKQIFYLSNSDVSSGFILNPFSNKKIAVWDSPLLEWITQWPEDKTIVLTTKPSQGIQGFMFFLNTQNGKVTNVLGGEGLTTLTNQNVSKSFYSVNSANSVILGVYDVKKNTLLNLPLRTFSEKCTWNKDNITAYCAVPKEIPTGQYPDFWYQGVASFSDEVWKINTETGTVNFLMQPEDFADVEIDVTKPFLSNNNYLLFINKKDSTLWSYQIPKQNTL